MSIFLFLNVNFYSKRVDFENINTLMGIICLIRLKVKLGFFFHESTTQLDSASTPLVCIIGIGYAASSSSHPHDEGFLILSIFLLDFFFFLLFIFSENYKSGVTVLKLNLLLTLIKGQKLVLIN